MNLFEIMAGCPRRLELEKLVEEFKNSVELKNRHNDNGISLAVVMLVNPDLGRTFLTNEQLRQLNTLLETAVQNYRILTSIPTPQNGLFAALAEQ